MNSRKPWHYSPDDPATEMQIQTIKERLSKRLNPSVREYAETLMSSLGTLTKKQATCLITSLGRSKRQQGFDGDATERQKSYILRLFSEKKITTAEGRRAVLFGAGVDTLTAEQADQTIKYLLGVAA